MHFTSSDSEMRFDSEDSEIYFIRGYEMAAERDVLCECPQTSTLTSSDDEAAAYADDSLADKEWTSNYQKHEDVDKKLDSMKTEKTDLKATKKSVFVLFCFFCFFFAQKLRCKLNMLAL